VKIIKKLRKPILITGATGFIGSNLVRYFVSNNIKVNILFKKSSNIWRIKDIIHKTKYFNLDLADKKKVATIIKKIKPKTIFHLAAHGAYSYQENLYNIKSSILDGTINLLEECKKYNFEIFINTGSSSEYGFKNKKMKEKDILKPNSYYSVFKISSTLFCQFQSFFNNLQIVTIRPFHVYGPYEEPRRLIPTLMSNMILNRKIKLVSPNISRDLVYVTDVINFYILIASKKNLKGQVFNLGFGKKITINKIYNYLKKITKYKKKNKWNSMKDRLWDQTIWFSDMSYVKKQLNWKPKINFKQGLKETLIWHRKFYNDK
jgi:nucleoside-diphosphate-sugar epimerase|tara:strand:+ start:1222 stop:2175 length:954 start_codon:yes stop_codon:yes gene_type:complete